MTRERYLSLLDELAQTVDGMGNLVHGTIRRSVLALDNRDVSEAKNLIEADNTIDAMRHDIEEKSFVVIATQQPTASDLRLVMASSMVATELERIGDYCAGIAKLTLTISGEPVGGPTEEIKSMAWVTADLLAKALTAFRAHDVEAAAEIWKRDDEVDDKYEAIFHAQIDEMVEHKKRIRRGTYMLWVAHNIERMADRVTNIAECTAFVATGDVATFRDGLRAESIPS